MKTLKLGDKVTGSYRTVIDPNDKNRSLHLAADDFDSSGKPVVLTITEGIKEEVTSPGNRKKEMPVIHFKETEKGLALNVTNAKKITQILGTNQIEQWKDCKIALYRTTVNAFGDPNTPCIRIQSCK